MQRKSHSSPKQQNNTLLNYFSRSPNIPPKNAPKTTPPKTPPKTPSESKTSDGVNGAQASTSNTCNTSSSQPKKLTPNGKNEILCDYNLYDLVWAKLEGYPWWPSIVCLHPTTNSYQKRKGKVIQVHVQFFDDPVSRSWIKLRDIKDYNGKYKSDVPLLKDPKWNTAVEFANEALKMDQNERWTLIAELRPSDDEDDVYLDLVEDNELSDVSPNKSNNSDTKTSPNKTSPKPKDKLLDNNEKPCSNLKRKANSKHDESVERKKSRKITDELSDDMDESEDDYKPGKSSDESSDDNEEVIMSEEEVEELDKNVEEIESDSDHSHKPNKSFKSQDKTKLLKTPESRKKIFERKRSDIKSKSKNRVSFADNSFISVDGNELDQSGGKTWPHLNYEFLKPSKIKDINNRYKSDKDYDKTTVSIPASFMSEQTPAHRQWWHFKSKNFDTVLFFKVGKFYELFHMDAVIAANELHLLYMRGEYCHCGFPEKAYKRYADVLVQRGYKVARIEQTETPQMMEERCKKMSKKVTKYDRVVARELCRVSTIGTRTCSVIDADSLTDANSYLLAIAENETETGSEFGVCFIDTSIGKFNIGFFSDDRYNSRLRTLISHNPPVELIIDKKNISAKTRHFLSSCLSTARTETIKEFWSPSQTLSYLEKFDPPIMIDVLKTIDTNFRLLCESNENCEKDCTSFSVADQLSNGVRLALKSMSGVINYLTQCLIVDDIVSMKLFAEYKPLDNFERVINRDSVKLPEQMILDSFTIKNLEIFENSLGGIEGTLYEVFDLVSTPFGKRLMHSWLCAPLCRIDQIEARQQAVTDLLNASIRCDVEEAIKHLKKLPDLERLLSKIHTQGYAKRAQSHPDSRAILFEPDLYSKRKIIDFISVLNGLKESHKLVETFQKHIISFKSPLLINCLKFDSDGGNYPHLQEKFDYFDNAFDHKTAKQEGKIVPQNGVDSEYDNAISQINVITKKLDNYLVEQRKYFGCKVVYFGTGKNRYQLEVPENATKIITKDNKVYELQSSRKGFKRYSTPFIKKLFEQLIVAEEAKEVVLQDIMRRIFETFDKYYHKWLTCIKCLSLLDVLISLYKCRNFLIQNGANACLPKFSDSNTPFISLINSSHPCLLKYCDHFIPNDLQLEDKLLLLTGPNMGGKSTLMRSVGLIVIMAQIGAYVPAEECWLTPVDRIFTRIGAFDRIVEGESTFFIELSETAMVLQHSTKNSLVLIDELGRGTSTFDGTAIACSVANELCSNIKCRTIFSTHYHSLVDEFKSNSNVQFGHMACMVENESETDPIQECITFLYKLKEGSCPKSYGFNAARLAGIPQHIVRNAFKKAKKFEANNYMRKCFRNFAKEGVSDNEVSNIIDFLSKVNI